MVDIPAGDFMMGSPSDEPGRDNDEGPQHRVHIRAFAVSKTPITVGEWRRYVDDTGSTSHSSGCKWDDPGFPQDERHPVVCVSWQDAQDYAKWISRKSGGNYRLLTEAEYEYASRAGSRTAYFWGDSADDLPRYANKNNKGTTPVASFKPNAFGLYDITGNVWEWTQDCYHNTYVGAPTDGSAWVTGGDCSAHVLRGGAWYYGDASHLRAASRTDDDPGCSGCGVGFRLARTVF